MITVNAMGELCPIPVIKTKKALKENAQVLVLVDNEIATQNLSKMAEQKGLETKIEKISDKEYKVFIGGEGVAEETTVSEKDLSQYVVAVHSNTMGHGNDELGKVLLKGFVYALTEQDNLPSHVLFYNGGAELTVTDSPVLDDLKKLAEMGVEILTCGLCLDFLNLKESHAVGEVTNMYRIVELMSANHVIKP